MTARIYRMADRRCVVVLSDEDGTTVFLASQTTRGPFLGHEQTFSASGAALSYAEDLADDYGCKVVRLGGRSENGGSAAHG